ncbi:MAG: metallophosphoesterase family protein [Elusimicrobiota bacterium]|nr:metallophosphoesterase family protein [Elusimicrobiota bacterium]
MKYAIFSDIHSNLEALETVLTEISKQNVDEYICCGDIVGYGPNPNECIEKIKSIKNIKMIAGNHDKATVGLFDIEWFNDNAKAAVLWTSSQLTGENKNFLKGLPEKIIEENFTAVHGSPREPIKEYLIKPSDMQENLQFFETQICFVGHSHYPFVYTSEKSITNLQENEPIEISSKSIINPGAVGQPRDGDNRACFMILDGNKTTFHRVNYDIKAVQKKMKIEKLPKYLVERLNYGR